MASIRRREGRPSPWEAVHRDPSGRQRTKAFRRKIDAQRWLDEQTAAIVTGQYVSPDAGSMTFHDYAEAWRAAQVHRPSTAEKVESTLRRHAYPTFGDQPLRTILPSHVQAWVKRLSATLAPSTIAVTHGIVASVLKAAVRDRRIVSSPCEGTKLPPVVREPVVPLRLDQVRALESALPPHYRAMVALGAATGLRLSEMLGLTVDRTGLWPPTDSPMLTVDRQLISLSGSAPHLGPPKRRASRRDIPLPRLPPSRSATTSPPSPPQSRTWSSGTTPTVLRLKRSVWSSPRGRVCPYVGERSTAAGSRLRGKPASTRPPTTCGTSTPRF